MRLAVLLFLGLLAAAPVIAAPATATPWIGIAIEAGAGGVRVTQALPDTPAERAGLRRGDVIVRVDGQPFTDPNGFTQYVRGRGVGATATLEVMRGDRVETVRLVLEARPDEMERLRAIEGKPAGPLDLVHVAGPPLAAAEGDVLVLEFMASWCGACRSASPTLDAWQAKYGARGLKVVAVSAEEQGLVARHHATVGGSYTAARDPGGALGVRYGVPAYPTFVVIDRAGTVRAVAIGAGDALAQVEKGFLPLLAP